MRPSRELTTFTADPELKRTLQSLACAKYRVITKDPKGKEVGDEDKFAFNTRFTDPKMRIKINQIQLKETKQENKATHERVQADRKYETQAAIVRIMKSRRAIGHQELMVEVIKATKSRGVLDAAEIKDNIEKYVPSSLESGGFAMLTACSTDLSRRITSSGKAVINIAIWHRCWRGSPFSRLVTYLFFSMCDSEIEGLLGEWI